jgi:hypothetical protein
LVLLWVGVPIAVTILAVLIVGLFNRPRRPAQVHESIADFERFRTTLAARERRGRVLHRSKRAS